MKRICKQTIGHRDFSCDLVHLVWHAPLPEIKALVLERLGTLIPFDMALWASGEVSQLTIHDAYLHNLPDGLLASWEAVKKQDRLLAHVIRHHGTAHDMFEFYGRTERHHLEIYRQHSRKFGIENAISIALIDEVTGLLEVLSLYRREPDARFDAAERVDLEFAFPLMRKVRQEKQNVYLACQKHQVRRANSYALCDKEGWLRQSSAQFAAQLSQGWPSWSGGRLPKPLVAWLKAQTGDRLVKGQYVFFAHATEDLIVLESKLKGPEDSLSQRELAIAKQFASGLTYREIAADLCLAPSTVRRHIEAIYRKMNITTKVELIRFFPLPD